ncbi:MAG TPA: CvpA family protein [Bacillota bacterium]|nr:CvpA family protein [Bacillota bacterium]
MKNSTPANPGIKTVIPLPALNVLDYGLLVVVGLMTLGGLNKGLVKQLVDLFAWILSLYLAYHLGNAVGQELDRWFSLKEYFDRALGPVVGDLSVGDIAVNVVGFIAVLIAVRIGVEVVSHLLDMVTKLPVISTFNRFGGAIFGLAKGLLIVFIAASVLVMLPEGALTGQIEGSYVIPTVLAISPNLYEQLKELFSKARTLV